MGTTPHKILDFTMDTTCPLPFLASVDFTKEVVKCEDCLTPTQLSYLGCVHLAASSQTIDGLLQYMQANPSLEAYVDVSEVESIDDILTILDAGACKIFVKSRPCQVLSAVDLSALSNVLACTYPEELQSYHPQHLCLAFQQWWPGARLLSSHHHHEQMEASL